jgi:hypothetical protein
MMYVDEVCREMTTVAHLSDINGTTNILYRSRGRVKGEKYDVEK